MYIGRIIGILLGIFALKSTFGVIIGFFAGWYFDKSLMKAGQRTAATGQSAEGKTLFLQTLFTAMGRLAKSDGRVSEEEIQYAENVIKKFDLSAENRQRAIQWFNEGVKNSGDFNALMAKFVAHTRGNRLMRSHLLELLLEQAMVDKVLHPHEEDELLKIAILLGVSAAIFHALLQQFKAQSHFHHGYDSQRQHQNAHHSRDALSDAYQALGVQASDSDAVVKKAYRKLISANHPDKLIAQGLPEAAIKKATERSQAIQQAYEMIKKSRQ